MVDTTQYDTLTNSELKEILPKLLTMVSERGLTEEFEFPIDFSRFTKKDIENKIRYIDFNEAENSQYLEMADKFCEICGIERERPKVAIEDAVTPGQIAMCILDDVLKDIQGYVAEAVKHPDIEIRHVMTLYLKDKGLNAITKAYALSNTQHPQYGRM